jgi:acyl-CoA thioester hydrolase
MPKFVEKYRIYYEDTDAGGVVYYANYLKFFERARTDFLRFKGVSQNDLLTRENIAFVVKRCEIDYIRPAKLDDLIEVSVVVDEVRAASIVMLQEIICEGVLLAKLKVEIVCVDALSFRPKKIPDFLLLQLNN